MSTVTNVILSFHILEDERSVMAAVNRFWDAERGSGFRAPIQCCSYTHPELKNQAATFIGGEKNIEIPIYVGAFNYLDAIGFLEHLSQVAWEYPDCVRCYIAEQEEGAFRERFQEVSR